MPLELLDIPETPAHPAWQVLVAELVNAVSVRSTAPSTAVCSSRTERCDVVRGPKVSTTTTSCSAQFTAFRLVRVDGDKRSSDAQTHSTPHRASAGSQSKLASNVPS